MFSHHNRADGVKRRNKSRMCSTTLGSCFFKKTEHGILRSVSFCIGLPILLKGTQESRGVRLIKNKLIMLNFIVSSTTTLAIPWPDGYSRWQKEGSSKRLFLFREKEEGLLLLLEQWWEFWVLPDSIFLGGGRQQRLLLFPRLNFGSWESSKSPMDPPPPPPHAAGRGVKTKIIRGRVHDTRDGFFSPFLLSKKYHSRHFIRTHLPFPNIILLFTTEYLALNEAANFSYFPPLSISIHLRASISFPFGAKQKSGASLFIFIFLKSHLWLFRLHVGKYFPTYTFLRDAKRISNFDFPNFPPLGNLGESPSLFSLLCPYCMASFPVYTIRKGFFFFCLLPSSAWKKRNWGAIRLCKCGRREDRESSFRRPSMGPRDEPRREAYRGGENGSGGEKKYEKLDRKCGFRQQQINVNFSVNIYYVSKAPNLTSKIIVVVPHVQQNKSCVRCTNVPKQHFYLPQQETTKTRF